MSWFAAGIVNEDGALLPVALLDVDRGAVGATCDLVTLSTGIVTTVRVALAVTAMAAIIAPTSHAQATAANSRTPGVVSTTFSYTGDFMGDVAGGARRGAAVEGGAAVQLTLLPGRLVAWRGARLFVFVLGTHGGGPSGLVGDIQGVSNLQAPAAMRLEEMWLQQNLLANRLSLLVGRYDLNSEFYRVQSGGLFVNSSFGIGPELAQSGVAGPSIYPNTAVGARLDFKPSPNVVWRAAVLDGVPVDRPGGSVRLFAAGDGALVVGEVAVLSRPDTLGVPRSMRFRIGRGGTHPYMAKFALGAWAYTARFPDLVDTLPTGRPVLHRGSRGAYLIADQMVWSAGNGRPTVLRAFAQLGVGDARVNQIGSYVGGGLTLAAPYPRRPQDELGLAVAAARNGSRYVSAQMGSDLTAVGETTVELTYFAQLGAWLSVQPDVQYVIRPGGTSATPNALVPGIRIAASH